MANPIYNTQSVQSFKGYLNYAIAELKKGSDISLVKNLTGGNAQLYVLNPRGRNNLNTIKILETLANKKSITIDEYRNVLKSTPLDLTPTPAISLGRTPRPQHWYDVSIGTSKANVTFTFNSRQAQVSCELYIKNDEKIYNKIKEDKTEVMSQLGSDIQFWDLPDSAAFRIIKHFDGDLMDETKWSEYFKWLVENGEKFQKTFKKYF
jgi:hypothetical protein